MAKKVRLDQLMVQIGLAETRSKAQALILAGEVRVGGERHGKAGDMVAPDAVVELTRPLPYVSRGGTKLAHALDTFGLDPSGLIALDAGASTGGFTDVLLQRGALHVYAVDVGYGILDWKLRQDMRVTAIERTNIRYLEALPGAALAGCAVIDVAFISLRLVLPAVQRLTTPEGWIVALVKPQFEAGAEQVGRGGVVRDSAVHAAVLREVIAFAGSIGLGLRGLTRSPITGPAGNVEFLVWLAASGAHLDSEAAINAQAR